jgi:hypothetical protein
MARITAENEKNATISLILQDDEYERERRSGVETWFGNA